MLALWLPACPAQRLSTVLRQEARRQLVLVLLATSVLEGQALPLQQVASVLQALRVLRVQPLP